VKADSGAEIEAVRRFNRFYTRQIGVLEEGLLASSFTLAQARVLFELGTRKRVTAGKLIDILGLDPGYLSRILQRFVDLRLITRERSNEDGRCSELALTARGRKAFGAIDRRSRNAIAEMITPISPARRLRLLDAREFSNQGALAVADFQSDRTDGRARTAAPWRGPSWPQDS